MMSDKLAGWQLTVVRWQDQMDVSTADADFPREVLETFLRCKREGFSQSNAVIELNGVKIAEDRTFADVARYVFTTILGVPAAADASWTSLVSFVILALHRLLSPL